MAEISGFFPDVNGDRSYTSGWLAKYSAAIISNGTYNGELAVTADGSGMAVTLPSGRAWINGYHYRNDSPLTLTIDNADGVLNRIDIIVLRWDINARSITAQVVKGTPASTATVPAITRTVEQYDLLLARVSIPAGTTAITQSLITDTRLDNSVCGIVTGVVKQVDTTTLYNQIAADLAGFKANNEAGFTSWFNGIKDILDSSTAGNLQNEIDGKAAKSTVTTVTLAASSWTGTLAPYQYVLSVAAAKPAPVRIEVGPAATATAEQRAAWRDAMIYGVSQAAGSITLGADGDKSAVDIPVEITVRGDC